jgi:hypothetical protein
LNVLAENDVKGAVGEGQCGDVSLANRNPLVQPDEAIEPTGGVAVLLGQIDRGNSATAPIRDEASGAADSGACVEYLARTRDSDQLDQLAGGKATHCVEVLEQPEVGGRYVVEVLSCGKKCVFDVASR